MQTMGGFTPPAAAATAALGAKAESSAPQVTFAPEKLDTLQQQYLLDAGTLWAKGLQVQTPELGSDKRFANPAWAANPLSAFAAAAYQVNARAMTGLADAVQGDAKTRARIRFAVEQWLAAASPSNFLALNAEAQQKAIATKGESISQGLKNLVHDIEQGHVSMTDESVFEVGKNVATTEGAVVFENELFQLLEYKPLTPKVFERPFLLVPPCINKFYILDLQPENSLIRYAVAQGHRTFVLSWRNPDASMAHATWDDYIENAAIKAIHVTQEITGAAQINALGFCVGGTILCTALAVLAARAAARADALSVAQKKPAKTAAVHIKIAHAATKNIAGRASTSVKVAPAKGGHIGADFPVASATFLTTLLDFSDTGILDVFIDEAFVQKREAELGHGGLMKGSELASTFSMLRPNELVWNYVVGNYLKGETPPAFDLLYWNSDATNLPGPFYAWYLRNTYLENKLIRPKNLTVCGQKIDLAQVRLPVFIYGSREDHIVPIAGAYASVKHLPGPKRFVMGASGHIAGVINPPAKNKRSHWIRDDGALPDSVSQWLSGATEQPGSWWTDWAAWLKGHAGKQLALPKGYGSAKYKVIEAAPGRYVKAKA